MTTAQDVLLPGLPHTARAERCPTAAKRIQAPMLAFTPHSPLVISSALVLLFVGAAPALACSPSLCAMSWARPADGTSVPANLGAIEYAAQPRVLPVGEDTSAIDDALAQSVELVSESGVVIPLALQHPASSPRLYWLLPTMPLEPGESYALKLPHPCGNPQDRGRLTQTFTTGPAAPMPRQLGSISKIVTEAVVLDGVVDDGICVTDLEATVARVELAIAPELRPYLAATRFTAYIDGDRRRDLTVEGPSDRAVMKLVAACDGRQGFLEPGQHQLELRAEVLGQTDALPPLFADIDLACSGSSFGCAMVTPGQSGSGTRALMAWLCATLLWRATRRGPIKKRSRSTTEHASGP
jgi:hypothetical protein